jgi:hypothetical protein
MGMFTETAIVDYRLLLAAKENKPLYSVFVCIKQREFGHFHFSFAAKERK